MLIVSQVIDIATVGASTAEDRGFCHGLEGEWRLEYAVYLPVTADAIDGSNYTSLVLKNGIGGTAVSSAVSNETVAFAAGTPRAFTLSENTSREFGQTDVLNINKAETGTGGILDGSITVTWIKIK